MSFFSKRFMIRLLPDDFKKIKKICKKNSDIYLNPSHFIRCAVRKELARFENVGGKK